MQVLGAKATVIFAGKSTISFSARCCGANPSVCSPSTITASRCNLLRITPLSENQKPSHKRGEQNCQGCARSKMSGLSPVQKTLRACLIDRIKRQRQGPTQQRGL